LRGLQNWKHLSSASSLCGACTEACPVGIDLHHHLLQNRRNATKAVPLWWEKVAYGGFAFLMRRPFLYRLSGKLGSIFFPLHKLVNRGPLDPLRSWTGTREFPAPARESFQDYWKKKQKEERHGVS
jgi:L-lactate dehydrogenase complex protein LldF